MKGRRTAALLCVLLTHALAVLGLLVSTRPDTHMRPQPQSEPMTFLMLFEEPEEEEPETFPRPILTRPQVRAPSVDIPDSDAADDSNTSTAPAYIDWPIERREAARRVLEAEAEAERVAKLFAGPGGTWASLTKRQQSELNHFRWKPGVDGLERDENGNTIYRINERCVLVNFVMIGCALGAKPPAYGDLFKDMRLYFDEQRRPPTNEGNGTEPESKRPPKWSKPLPERNPEERVP